jgi:hypothetical protein
MTHARRFSPHAAGRARGAAVYACGPRRRRRRGPVSPSAHDQTGTRATGPVAAFHSGAASAGSTCSAPSTVRGRSSAGPADGSFGFELAPSTFWSAGSSSVSGLGAVALARGVTSLRWRGALLRRVYYSPTTVGRQSSPAGAGAAEAGCDASSRGRVAAAVWPRATGRYRKQPIQSWQRPLSLLQLRLHRWGLQARVGVLD